MRRNFLSFVVLTIFLSLCESSQKIHITDPGTFQAGVAKLNGSLPVGTPLAGYNHDQRRVPYWPLPEFKEYTTFMTPSLGHLQPTWVKALVLDNGQEQFAFITLDGIGSDENVNILAYEIASSMGFKVPMNNCIFSCSHTHSGPGAVSSDFLWAMAPATDLCVPELQRQLATSMATVMLEAVANLQPASIAVGTGDLIGVTQNRRAGISHYVKSGTIDPHLGIIRVDAADGTPMATVWNFAMHGTCYGPDNMYFSGDIMGAACDSIEDAVGGIAMFINADAGDIDPTDATCNNPPQFDGAPIIAAAVKAVRANLTTANTGIVMSAYSQVINFGPTDLNITLQRFDNCTTGGELDMYSMYYSQMRFECSFIFILD